MEKEKEILLETFHLGLFSGAAAVLDVFSIRSS